jgi:phage gp46-like protein
MAVSRKYFDLAVGESEGNGGDLQQIGNDLAVVYSVENQVYLALFGGNVEGNTDTKIGSGWWGNKLFFGNDTAKQFNSNTERILNTVALSSAGRIKIENAVKDDLKYLNANITVIVTIPSINTVRIDIKAIYPDGTRRLSIITFGRRTKDGVGDFSLLDFNEDFF